MRPWSKWPHSRSYDVISFWSSPASHPTRATNTPMRPYLPHPPLYQRQPPPLPHRSIPATIMAPSISEPQSAETTDTARLRSTLQPISTTFHCTPLHSTQPNAGQLHLSNPAPSFPTSLNSFQLHHCPAHPACRTPPPPNHRNTEVTTIRKRSWFDNSSSIPDKPN